MPSDLTGCKYAHLREKMSELEEPTIAAFNTLIDEHMHSKATANAASSARTNSQPNRGRGGNSRNGQFGQSGQQNRQPLSKKRRQIMKGKCFHCANSDHFANNCSLAKDIKCKSVIMNIILSKKKFQICSELPFAGLVISAKGISPDPERTRALSDFPNPKDITGVRSFLGLANQLSGFVPDFAHMTVALRGLTGKNASFIWLDEPQKKVREGEKAFDQCCGCDSL